jgi:hypothetical protein
VPGLLWLVACRDSVPLSEVPIEGGTEEQQDLVRAVLLDLDEALGPGRVVLRRIRLRPLEEFAGLYRQRNLTIELDSEQESLGGTLRHEVCHALADQEGLEDEPHRLLDAVAEGLFDPSYPSAPPDDVGALRHPWGRRSEALAAFCEMGWYGAWLAMAREPGPIDEDPELRQELGAWLLEHVWIDFVMPEPLEVGSLDAVVTQAGTTEIRPTEDPRVVVTSEAPPVHLDLYTGEVVQSALPALESHVGGPPGPGTFYYPADGFHRAGFEEGPAAVNASFWLYHLGTQGAWLAATPQWREVEGLGSYGSTFTADGQVWLAWTEDSAVLWASLGG